jgi:hypothetical protein
MTSHQKFDSRTLRKLAEHVVAQITQDGRFSDRERADLVTSLMRQWVTYDCHAAIFSGVQLWFFNVGHTPLGNPSVPPKPGPKYWLSEEIKGRKIDPDLVPQIIEELNRQQSAEVTDRHGRPLRFWVTPHPWACGVEVLTDEPVKPDEIVTGRERAMRHLRQRFGDDLPPGELDVLADSVVRQWNRFDGHACVFASETEQICLHITKGSDGRSNVMVNYIEVEIESLLASLGVPASEIPKFIAEFNIGGAIEITDNKGVKSRMWHDPKTRRVIRETINAATPVVQPMSSGLPSSCPKCSALVMPSPDGAMPTRCPLCGHALAGPG